MIRNPIKDIIAVGTIITTATYLFIKYVKHYEKKHGSTNKK